MARFVALGDSLTEGVGDPHPSWPNGLRGWADLVAARLAASDPSSDYANLALRAKTARDVIEEQVPRALELRPDIVTIWAGGNDILRPRLRLDDVLRPLDDALAQLATTAATVIVFTGFEVSGSPVLAPLRARVRALNAGLHGMARTHGALVADVSRRDEWRDRRWWADDRVHPSAVGHQRLAAHVTGLLGLGLGRETPVGPAVPVAPPPPRGLARAMAEEFAWWRVHAGPHIARWATGASRREVVAPKWAVPVRPAVTFPWRGVDNDPAMTSGEPA